MNLPNFQLHDNLFFGLDLAKKTSQLAILTPAGHELANFPFLSTKKNFVSLAKVLRPTDSIALEVSTPANAVMSIFKHHTPANAVLWNPLFTKSISKAVVKSDKEDARKLADLKRTNYLETVWFPDVDTLRLRHFISDRESLVKRRTELENQVHSVLQRNLITYEFSDLFGGEGSVWLALLLQSDELDIYEQDRIGFLRQEINRQIALVDDLDATIAAFIGSRSAMAHQVNLLLSIPGVSLAVGATILAAVGDISRFPTKQKFAAYFGLTQRIKQTGGKPPRIGHISKQGNAYARFMLIEAAEHFRKSPTIYQRLYQRIQKKKGHNVAKVAVARRLAELIWSMLTKNEEFIYAKPRLTDEKSARVKQLARAKAKLKLAKQPTNSIIKGTNLRGRDLKAEIYQRSCDEALRIADLMELGKKLSEISPTGFNPRKPNHTDWHKVLKVVAENYARELAKNKVENLTEKNDSKNAENLS